MNLFLGVLEAAQTVSVAQCPTIARLAIPFRDTIS